MQRVIGGIVLALIGAIMTAKPGKVWEIMEKWKIREEAQAPQTYLRLVRIIGAGLAIAGILVALDVLH